MINDRVKLNINFIGMAGRMRSGKDNVAYNIKHYMNQIDPKPYHIINTVSLAGELKKDLQKTIGLPVEKYKDTDNRAAIQRAAWQVYGTEVCRKVDPDVWIKRLMTMTFRKIEKDIQHDYPNLFYNVLVIVPDIRYDNEAKFIRNPGQYILDNGYNTLFNFVSNFDDPLFTSVICPMTTLYPGNIIKILNDNDYVNNGISGHASEQGITTLSNDIVFDNTERSTILFDGTTDSWDLGQDRINNLLNSLK